MPIYEYRCAACGHQEEFIQKVSDKPLTKCSECGKNKFERQISNTAFQLKGDGWYVTDFKSKKLSSTTSSQEAANKTTETVSKTTGTEATEPKKSDVSKKE